MKKRTTTQRQVIQTVFQELARPLSAQEVLDAAQQQLPNLGIATVYRAINALTDEKWLKPVELPSQPTRYELADIDHHHHFQCNLCHRVFDIDACPGNLNSIIPPGFTVLEHDITLYGICPDCKKKPSSPSRRKNS